MHILIWANQTEEAILLIKNGADINAIGCHNETPLHVALRQNNSEVIQSRMVILNLIPEMSVFLSFSHHVHFFLVSHEVESRI